MTANGIWLLILRKGQAFIPTMGKTSAGFYVGIEPVEVVDASDRARIQGALIRAISRGNPSVPTPARGNYPEDPLLKHAGVKSLSAFEKLAQSWKLSKQDGSYRITNYTKNAEGPLENPETAEIISGDEPLESVVNRLIERATKHDLR